MFSTTLYRVSPPWIQSQLVSLRGWTRKALREGPRFKRIVDELESTQWYSREQFACLQYKKVSALLHHAEQHVAYYQQLFATHALRAADIRSVRDLEQLPLLEKSTVQNNPGLLIAQNVKGARIKVSTSGSTGTPLQLTQNLDAVNRENAFIWRQLTWAGYRPGEPRAWLRGDMVVPFASRKPPFWRINSADRMLMLSSYHLSADSAAAYVRKLEQYDPVLIQAYPSSIAFLGRFLHSCGRNYRGRRLRAIVTTSETLLEADARLIEARFGCRVFEQYGSAERVTMIQTCEHGTRHLLLDYGLTQFVPMGDGRYEIIGTGFNNWAMPLIRYRSGDSVELDHSSGDCPCGRTMPAVKKVHGRNDDYIKTPDGRQIGRLDHIFKGVQHIIEAQIVQERLNEVILRIVPLTAFSELDRRRLLRNAHERLGENMNIRIEIVDTIARTSGGKLRAVVCSV